MARTHKKVGYSPTGKLEDVTPDMAARGVEEAFRMLEGRWKMLIQQLRELERDGIVGRTVYPQVPPKVEYDLTKWGQAMCPALDCLLECAAMRPKQFRRRPPNRC